MTGVSSNLQEQIDVIGKLASRDVSGIDSEALDGLKQATAALAARVVELEARSIVATQSVIITDNLDWANVNAPLVYHKYKTNRTDASISYIKTAASLSLMKLAITASAPTSIALTGTDRKEQFCILQSGCIRRPHVT